jgi:hypothetical protein
MYQCLSQAHFSHPSPGPLFATFPRPLSFNARIYAGLGPKLVNFVYPESAPESLSVSPCKRFIERFTSAHSFSQIMAEINEEISGPFVEALVCRSPPTFLFTVPHLKSWQPATSPNILCLKQTHASITSPISKLASATLMNSPTPVE